jgi:hypothetical protein
MQRQYPPNKVKNGNRYIYFKGDYLKFPRSYGYYQYLIEVLAPHLLGKGIFEFNKKSTRLSQYLEQYVFEMMFGPKGVMIKARNMDIYVLELLSDLNDLYLNDSLDKKIVKRLNTNSEQETRGVIYEIKIAAAFVRMHQPIAWLHGDQQPEFKVNDGGVDVEAKRRDRSAAGEFNMDVEISAIKRNLWDALKKKRSCPLLVFMDTDLPPRHSSESKIFNETISKELGQKEFNDIALIMTNNGYDDVALSDNTGKNSFLIIRGNRAPSPYYINEAINSSFASLLPEFSDEWPIH